MSAEGSFIRFSRRDMAGALVVNVFAVISAVGLMGVALRVAYLAYQNYRHRDAAKSKEFGFFNTQVGYYAICLLISNCMNSVAGLIGITFLVQGGISEDGLLCKTQATVMQFGSLGAAYFTCAIAIHTFNSLVLRRRQSVWVYSIAIIVGWLMAGALATLPLYQKSMRSGAIYGGSGLACGVREVHAQLQFFYHLLPIFVCAVISAILYALIFLVLRGTLVIKGGVRLSLNPHERYGIHLGRYQRFVAGIAKSMLWFPAAYIVLLVPYSVTRLLTIGRFTVPFEATVVAFVCWFMLGIVNVLLLYNTFRVLSPAFSGASSSKGKVSFMPQDMYKTQSEKQSMESTSPFNGPAMIVSPERAISVSSYYNYEGRRADVERQISPVDVLNRGVSDNARYHQQSPSLTSQRHLRESSQDSLLSLPTPPRRRSPIASAAPTPTWMPAVPESASPTRVHRQSFLRLSDQSDRDATSWTTRQHLGGSQPNGQPSISAVNPNFDRSTMRRARHSRNLTSPTAPVRPRRSVDFAADHTRNPSNPPSYI